MTACRYFDGRSSRPHEAALSVVDGALAIDGPALARREPRERLSFAPARGDGPARIALADGAVCEIADRAAARSLFDALGYRPDLGDRLAARRGTLALVIGGFVAVSLATWLWGVPLAADAVTRAMPLRWQTDFGHRLLTQLDERRLFAPTTLPAPRRDALVARVGRLRFADERPDFRIVFRSLGVPNAYALPGDTIVVSDELVALAPDDDAIVTVLGHEIAHVVHRDSMRGVVRATLLSAFAAWYMGDVSTLAATFAGGLAGLHFSRDAEHRADLYALDLMRTNAVPTAGAAELFRRLETWTPPVARDTSPKTAEGAPDDGAPDRDGGHRAALSIPTYLSTHPATGGRIRLFETGHE